MPLFTNVTSLANIFKTPTNAVPSLFFPQALIRCYCFEKYFNHAVNAAAAAQRKFSNVPIYSFFHAYGTLMQGKLEKNTNGSNNSMGTFWFCTYVIILPQIKLEKPQSSWTQ